MGTGGRSTGDNLAPGGTESYTPVGSARSELNCRTPSVCPPELVGVESTHIRVRGAGSRGNRSSSFRCQERASPQPASGGPGGRGQASDPPGVHRPHLSRSLLVKPSHKPTQGQGEGLHKLRIPGGAGHPWRPATVLPFGTPSTSPTLDSLLPSFLC